LPSLDNPVAGLWQSVSLDISIDDFALDLRQDLLILVEMLVPTATVVHIHLRSFQSLSAHPKAASSTLTLDSAPVSGNSTIVVDLSGKHLGLLFSHDHQARSDHDRICVWDWTTGETVFVSLPCVSPRHAKSLTCPQFLQGSSTKLTSFVFLMDDVLLVPDVAANALSVYIRNVATGQFELGEMFGLPDLAEGCVLHNANSRYKSRGVHQPGAGAHALPSDAPGPGFYVAPEMELVVISLEYRADGWSHFFTLICPKSTFLNPHRSRPAVAATQQQPRLALTPLAIPSPVPAAVQAVAPPLIHMPASTVASPLFPHTNTIPPPAPQLQMLPAPSIDLPAPADAPLPAATNPAVPWESWGPISTRLIREPLRLWDYFHASTRFLALTASSSGGVDDEDSGTGTQRTLTGPRAHLRVLDFHPGVVAKAGGRFAEPSSMTEHQIGPATREAVRATTPHPRESSTTNDGTPVVSSVHESSRDAAGPSTRPYGPTPAPPAPAAIQQHSAISAQPPPDVEAGTMEGPTRRIRVVRGTAPNVVRAGPVFFQDVYTRLPYVETTTTSAFDIANVLCDHERVIGLKVRLFCIRRGAVSIELTLRSVQTNDLLDMESLDVFLL